jgi:predicted nucleic acid-binding protein
VIVVSDASPLNYLVLIDAIDVLPKLFAEVFVPSKVMEELRQPNAPDFVARWANRPPAWLTVRSPKTELVFSVRLDPGEAHAISLAKELHAPAILIDEKKGRRIAKMEGLNAVGTITVLQLAAQMELLELKPALFALERTTFRISPSIIRAVLEADAGQRPPTKGNP